MTPPDAAASASVAPSLTPDPSTKTGAVGAIVSSVNVAVLGAASWGLPAASVCATDTVTDPSPSVSTSSAVSGTATAEPVPVTVFTTDPDWPMNVVTTLAPFSPVTLTTPPAADASASVAPSLTPEPSATVAAVGTSVSTPIDLAVLSALTLPATSTCFAVKLSEP